MSIWNEKNFEQKKQRRWFRWNFTMSLLVMMCRRSSRWVFNGVNGWRRNFRCVVVLWQLTTDADDALLNEYFSVDVLTDLFDNIGGKEFSVVAPREILKIFEIFRRKIETNFRYVDSLIIGRVDKDVSKYPLSLLNDWNRNKKKKIFPNWTFLFVTVDEEIRSFVWRLRKNGWVRIWSKVKRFFASFCKIRLIKSFASFDKPSGKTYRTFATRFNVERTSKIDLKKSNDSFV